MKNKITKSTDPLFWVLAALCTASFLAHLACYPSLPEMVPSHWNSAGEVNGQMPKAAVLLLDLLPLGLLLLMQFLPCIEPKREGYTRSKKAWPITKNHHSGTDNCRELGHRVFGMGNAERPAAEPLD